MNKKQAIIKAFREQFTHPLADEKIPYWRNTIPTPEDIEQFLSQKLDEYGEELIKEFGEIIMEGEYSDRRERWIALKGQDDKD